MAYQKSLRVGLSAYQLDRLGKLGLSLFERHRARKDFASKECDKQNPQQKLHECDTTDEKQACAVGSFGTLVILACLPLFNRKKVVGHSLQWPEYGLKLSGDGALFR